MNAPVPRHRVLVIDDTPAIHADFKKVFESQTQAPTDVDAAAALLFDEVKPVAVDPVEFTIESALQGKEGVDLVRAACAAGQPYSLAFVDMRMPPGWDGLETIREMWKVDPRIQVVICTAHSDHSWHNIRAELGQSDSLIILKKPFDHIEARQLAHALGQKWFLARQNEERLSQLNIWLQERTRAAQLAEARFSHAFAANPHAQSLLALDPFEILEINPAFTRQFGVTMQDIAGQTPETFGRMLDPTRWRDLLHRLKSGEPVDEHAFKFQRGPGDVRDLLCSARPVTIGGRPCSIWLVRDVTEQKALELQLRQAQKMEAVGQLSAGIAHDFNNLLTIIRCYTSVALDELKPGPLRSGLTHVQDAADSATALTRQLLVFSRRQITKPEPVNVGTALTGLRDMLSRVIPERIRLTWETDARLPEVFSDLANLEQAVLNLIINARDATPQAGTIAVAIRQTDVTEADARRRPKARAGAFVAISVSDTGTGIPPEVQARLFEPFFTTKESGKGTGLGLSTVLSIVEQHKGWVEVDSKVGRGTTFTLFIPAMEASAVVAERNRVVSDNVIPRGRGQRVLIVEDDPIVRMAVASIVKQAGYVVAEAEDGPAALQLWESTGRRFDLLFTDLMLPKGLNGVELAKTMRADAPGLAVIFSTGYSDQLLKGDDGQLADGILLKPFVGADVVAKIHAAFQKRAPAPLPLLFASG